jgi:hypothetical protein
VPEPSAFEVEMAIEKLKRYKSPGIDQIPAELIKAEGSKICYTGGGDRCIQSISG